MLKNNFNCQFFFIFVLVVVNVYSDQKLKVKNKLNIHKIKTLAKLTQFELIFFLNKCLKLNFYFYSRITRAFYFLKINQLILFF